ncbi:hypothetical protein IV38_GL000114 [Lactobacillus selangorensis]|uniref:Phage protein n=1 Tax=Lactobacillus selangorensis TaxID=81857 RepID=A0A0R2FSZ3_9LACO|nr:tail assembly chaperone [Lactobacillus selangorensis]KRN29234.1 hypothetical protein IV38_GL000114 [Lactobacillus selangorensis]KRN31408.1 hypothetical protein IV40_GL001404 [Lactobacillus selangorensis]
MQITIDKEKQELHFGVKFVRELDKTSGVTANGVAFGMGLTKSIPALKAYDPAVLSDVIYAATITNDPRVSHDEVDDYIDRCTNLEKLFDDVQKQMNSANAIKVALKNATA